MFYSEFHAVPPSLGKLRQVLRLFGGDDSNAFAHYVEPIGGQVRQQLLLSIGPQNFRAIQARMIAHATITF